jgi:hypothetical protein
MPRFITCFHCSRSVKRQETLCPHCGGTLRDAEGNVPWTAAALLLGLSAATASVGACSDDKEGGSSQSTSSSPTTSQGGAAGQAGDYASTAVAYGVGGFPNGPGGAGGTSDGGGGAGGTGGK